MINIMDWLLGEMQLVDEETDDFENEVEKGVTEKSWMELLRKKKDKICDSDERVYIKNIQMYSDGKTVIDNFKSGCVCIFQLDPLENPDAQGMMNYICGGIYALDGDVTAVGENVFMTTHTEESDIVKPLL